ncbi:4Fe-4S double cluster binding domain-containing protein [Dehalogenimonas sp. 4OHTPN]|uniref:4Fe-4S double cluster binding domain-containing protein n=1 Tax=Dehalogenimonas sp. 4OHTPN TaxID=3166643 RepID=A0AAU8G7E4_9CHLR
MITALAEKVTDELALSGYRAAVASIDRLAYIEQEFRSTANREEWRKSPHLSQHIFDFTLPQEYQAQSIIVVAAPVAPVNIGFVFRGEYFSFDAPPLSEDYEKDATNILSEIQKIISPRGYRLSDSNLPTKILASHCGLISNGVNNIGYIDGMGSYFRLSAYFSDIEPGKEKWLINHPVNPKCAGCSRCIDTCPTKCIERSSFRVNRCLSLLSKEPTDFPVWINNKWHNALIGCRICQKVCPLNQEVSFKTSIGADFDETETTAILSGDPLENLHSETREKLRYFTLEPLYPVLSRNLRLLFKKYGLTVN